jgi:hypothetical protein
VGFIVLKLVLLVQISGTQWLFQVGLMANGSADGLMGNQYLFGAHGRSVLHVGRIYL